MSLIVRWIVNLFLEKVVKASLGSITDFFKTQNKLREEQLEAERKAKLYKENRAKLDQAIKAGNLDEIAKAATNFINGVDSSSK
jgi:hypothetical protein